MGRRTTPKGKKGDGEQYVNVPYAQLKSKAWRSLSGAAVKLWCELHTRFNGGNNGRLTLSYAEAADALGMGKASVQRAYAELQEKGFIVLELEGNWYHRRAHEWRLTTKSVQGRKATVMGTNEWRNWQPSKTKRGSKSEPSRLKLVPFQNPDAPAGSVSEPVKVNLSKV